MKSTKIAKNARPQVNNYLTSEVKDSIKRIYSMVTAAVHHIVQLRKGLGEMRITLCGSLMDEASILNVLNQMANFTEPYIISKWNKFIEPPLKFNTFSQVFFLISPNFAKCKSLNKYAFSIQEDKRSTLHMVKIANAEVPSGSPFPENYLDATSMNQKELANEKILSAEKMNKFPQFICRRVHGVNMSNVTLVSSPSKKTYTGDIYEPFEEVIHRRSTNDPQTRPPNTKFKDTDDISSRPSQPPDSDKARIGEHDVLKSGDEK